MNDNEASIVLKGLGKWYGEDNDRWAVRNVTFAVYPGDLTVLMGPSGSGKTTLISLMGGLLAPSEGRLSVCGTDLERSDEAQRQIFRRHKVGFVFQSCNLLASLTARENVQVALTLRGQVEAEADELLREVGLEDKVDSYPMQLSGGQRQRVAVVRALAGGPPVLLADEPTAALDAFQGRRVMDLLRSHAHDCGTTVVVVTHDPRVREFADRVVEMEDGRVSRIVRLIRKGAIAPATENSAVLV